LVGTSIGGVTAAILAGTSPERRYTALRYFWESVASADAASPLLPEVLRRPLQYGQALASRLFGRAALYFPRPMDLTGGDERPEEAAEVAIDAVRGERDAVIAESVDLLYNLVALWSALGVVPIDVWAEMDRREALLGMVEEAAEAGGSPDMKVANVRAR